MSMRETNILLTAVGRRAYLVEYFKEALRGTGGKVYAANCVRDTTGLLAADDFEIVPKSADPGYVDSLVELCRRWRIALLFSLHDWDAPVIARNKERFLAVGTTPVMGDARLLSTCLDKYSTASAMEGIGVAVPWTTLSLADAAAKMRELRCPMIVKPRWGQGSLGLFKVYSEKELEWAFNLSDVLALRFAANCPEIDVSQPQVVVQQPAPVVVQQPAPVVVQQQPVGHYETRMQNVWVEGRYVDQTTPQGAVVRTWQPGHYEQQQTQVWVTP